MPLSQLGCSAKDLYESVTYETQHLDSRLKLLAVKTKVEAAGVLVKVFLQYLHMIMTSPKRQCDGFCPMCFLRQQQMR